MSNSTFAQLDPHGAAGPAGILTVNNSVIAYYTKAGAQLWTTNQSQFFVPLSAGDCKAIYDPASQRFFLIAQSAAPFSGPNSSTLSLVAVSRSSNPASGGTNDWRFYAFDASTGIDYPSIGIDAQALYVAYGKSHKFWMAMNKAHLVSGATNASTAQIVTDLLNLPGNIPNFSLQAVSVIGPASPGDVAYCVTRNSGDTNKNEVMLFAITNVLGTMKFFSTNIPVPGLPPIVFQGLGTDPQIAPQANTANRLFHGLTVDGNAFWREGELWFSEVVASTNQVERTVLRYYKLKTGGFPDGQATLDEVGDLDGGPGTWRIQAAIGGNARGDVAFVYTQCSSNSFPAMFASIRRAGQTGFETQLVKSSAASWTVGGNWADYPVVTPDPEDQTFWVSHLDVVTTNTVNIQWANLTRDSLFYVDVNASGAETGTRELPYHSVRAAHTAAAGAQTLVIKPADYPEPTLPLRLDKNIRLENPYPSGTVRIGP